MPGANFTIATGIPTADDPAAVTKGSRKTKVETKRNINAENRITAEISAGTRVRVTMTTKIVADGPVIVRVVASRVAEALG